MKLNGNDSNRDEEEEEEEDGWEFKYAEWENGNKNLNVEVSQDVGVEAPIPISVKLGDFNTRIVTAAEHPHLSIPETEAGKTRKQFNKLMGRSLMCVSVGAAVALVGLGAYRIYAARKSSSG